MVQAQKQKIPAHHPIRTILRLRAVTAGKSPEKREKTAKINPCKNRILPFSMDTAS